MFYSKGRVLKLCTIS